MERWIGTVAVVTGASAGIGASVCEKLVAAGLKVAGFARRSDRVEKLANKLTDKPGILHAVKCDVRKEEDIVQAFQWVKKNLGPVQIIINNAGLFKVGSILEGDPNDWKTVFDTNVFGLCMCTNEAFKQMKAAGVPGHIVQINSVAGHSVITGDPPKNNMYSPSKYAVTCLTEVMRRELLHSETMVKISSISPSYVDTEIFEASGLQLTAEKRAQISFLQPDDVADSVLYVLGTPPHVQIHELTLRATGSAL